MEQLLFDIDDAGSVTVSLWTGTGHPRQVGAPFRLEWPLTVDELEDLRWYLEDYLVAPFGVYEDRGPQIAALLDGWGEQMLAALTGGSGPVHDALLAVRTRAGGGPFEMVIRSASGQVLGLPWELCRLPGQPSGLVLQGVQITRGLPEEPTAGPAVVVPGEVLRVLMVISRPAGGHDVGFRMVARPLLEELDNVQGAVDLVVLRPPTFDALGEVLDQAQTAGEPFQVVHFDGHGVMAKGAGVSVGGEPLRFHAGGATGFLAFEKPGGGTDLVDAARVARLLAARQVPVVVLNACQSGAVGREVEAAVATRILAEGAASVVAMGYSVYAVAAAEFMAALYGRLFAGQTLAAGVAAGRARLAQSPWRPTPKGLMALADWMVPVHYDRAPVSFAHLACDTANTSREGILAAAVAAEGVPGGMPAAVGEFVGRDGQFYDLEANLHARRVVVLHGTGGVGKTELAKAFARWWQVTGGVDDPAWVVWYSFEPGLASYGLPGLLAAIGLQVFGAPFAAVDDAARDAAVVQLMRNEKILVVLDNFESAYSMPDPDVATPPLNAEDRQALAGFLARVAGGKSGVILTSRTEEAWLGPDVGRIGVEGLPREDANRYADILLAGRPRAQAQRRDPVFAELMAWLGGHPLSMRLTLPRLENTTAQALLDELAGDTHMLAPATVTDGRHGSLAACVAYSARHLPPGTLELLTAVSGLLISGRLGWVCLPGWWRVSGHFSARNPATVC